MKNENKSEKRAVIIIYSLFLATAAAYVIAFAVNIGGVHRLFILSFAIFAVFTVAQALMFRNYKGSGKVRLRHIKCLTIIKSLLTLGIEFYWDAIWNINFRVYPIRSAFLLLFMLMIPAVTAVEVIALSKIKKKIDIKTMPD